MGIFYILERQRQISNNIWTLSNITAIILLGCPPCAFTVNNISFNLCTNSFNSHDKTRQTCIWALSSICYYVYGYRRHSKIRISKCIILHCSHFRCQSWPKKYLIRNWIEWNIKKCSNTCPNYQATTAYWCGRVHFTAWTAQTHTIRDDGYGLEATF